MDIFGIFLNINWIFIFIFTLFVCYLFYMLRDDYDEFQRMGIPYPKPIPIFGNIFSELMTTIHTLDLENSKKYGRVYGFYEASKPILKVSDPIILKEILVKQFNNFCDRRKLDNVKLDPMTSKMLPLLRGKQWKMTRSIMTPTFTSGKLKQMTSLINKCSIKLVSMLEQKVGNGESVDTKDVYIMHLLEIFGCCAFGVEINAEPTDDNKSFFHHAKRFLFNRSLITYFFIMLLPETFTSALKLAIVDIDAVKYFRKMLIRIIKMRESGLEKRNDFLQTMLDILKEASSNETSNKFNAEEKSAIKTVFTHEVILSQCMMFLAAGFQTTSTALSFISYCIAAYPECQEKLIEEVDSILLGNEDSIDMNTISKMIYMDKFIMECFRMYPPSLKMDRLCAQDTQIGDLLIKKDMVISIPIYAIHHDEEFYPDPSRFDPERFSPENKEQRDPYTYIPFGIGPRNCIGMRFALTEMKIIIINILTNFRFRLAPETKVPLNFRKGSLHLEPVGGIKIKFEKRNREKL